MAKQPTFTGEIAVPEGSDLLLAAASKSDDLGGESAFLPPQQAQKMGWTIILHWLLVSAAGASAVGSVHWLGSGIVNGILMGTAMGLMQWLVLRRMAKGVWWWVLATAVGGATGAVLATTMLWMFSTPV